MAKARSRTAARKIKDRWKAKEWYSILAPPAFDNVTIADTLADNSDALMNRVTAVSLQDLTNDFRKSHITLYFKVNKIEENNAYTQYVGHTLTSDYLRRMVRRRRSKIDGVYDVTTRDGAVTRVKPFATTDKRIQNSQKRVVRESMKNTIAEEAKKSTLSEFVKNIIDGKIGSEIYKSCKILYPVKRIEIFKTEVISQPSIMIEDKKPKKKEEKPEEKPEETKEEPKEKKTKKKEKKTEEVKEPETKEEIKEEPKEEKPEEEPKEEKPAKKEPKAKPKKVTKPKTETKPKKETKPKAKKTPAKKATPKKPATKAKTTKKKATIKKKTSKKK
jgi:small subunit ribosomal protein S3Ae